MLSPRSDRSSTIMLQDTFRLRMMFRSPMFELLSCMAPAQSFTTLRLSGLVDCGNASVSAMTGRVRSSVSFRIIHVSIILYCGKTFVTGMHTCMECNRGIYYPTGLSVFRTEQPRDPTGAQRPQWLTTELQKASADQAWDMVADSEVARFRNSTIARSVIEDHRKVSFFGGVVIKAVDHGLPAAVKQKFPDNVRGPMMGAICFDISIERLIDAITGPRSTMRIGEFFEANEHSRRYYASLFLNCREKPLCSYLFYSGHVRDAYLLALSKHEISPLFSLEQDIAGRWDAFEDLRR